MTTQAVVPNGMAVRAEGARFLRSVAASIVLALLLVSFEPFSTQFTAAEPGAGNVVNQLGYGALLIVSILCHLTITPGSALRALAHPVWCVVLAWLIFASLHSPWPDDSLRAAAFTVTAMLAVSVVLCLPSDGDGFRRALMVASFAVLGLSYFGVVFLPGLAIHDASGPEAQHAGLWRGIYSHKNVAGPVMACLSFAGLYLWRCRWRWVGIGIMISSALFVVETGSKTTAVLMPAVALLVIAARRLGRGIVVATVATLLAGVFVFTLGAAIVPAFYDLLQWFVPGTTLTGRLDLWRFALRALDGRGWTGMGFDAFWTTPMVHRAEVPFGSAWDPRGIVNAHNGYLDIAIALGWPGLAVAVVMLVLLPLRDFVRAGRDGEAANLAEFFLMMLAFTLLNAFLESFMFARNNPVWMILFLSVCGLRLLARADNSQGRRPI